MLLSLVGCSYLVTVLAVDGGDPPKTGSVVVNISVLDANDNNPQFDNSSYEVAVSVYRPLSASKSQQNQ